LTFRTATRADVPAILALLADDDITRARAAAAGLPEPAAPVAESVDAALWAAFEAIDADPRNELIVAESPDGTLAATCQLTFTPSLSRGGAERLTIEAVRVRADLRGHGHGRALIHWSLDRARERGCRLAQLTTDKQRTDARRFYESLGFTASHEGMKLSL
jgi:GNAT superfamily N-acetyltransferase